MIRSTIFVLENSKKEKKANAVHQRVTAPLSGVSVPYGSEYEVCLTEYAYKLMIPQLQLVNDVKVLESLLFSKIPSIKIHPIYRWHLFPVTS